MKIAPARAAYPGQVSEQISQPFLKAFKAPIRGLVTNAPLNNAIPDSALVLENFFPTSTGIEPRGGTELRCSIAGPVKALFEYGSDVKTFYAADDNNIYEFDHTSVSGTSLSPIKSGQTSGDYSTFELQTLGGMFLLAVNGSDAALVYNGSSWQTANITQDGGTFDTSVLSHVWGHHQRVFFVEKNSMTAWYLGVNSFQGEAGELPLAGVFQKGGSLLFGSTWSSDSGSGMDDRCVFATTEGEFAVYAGSDPGDIDNWSLTGVYEIGKPLSKNSVMRIGGDLFVATKSGLISLSAAASKDPTQLSIGAISAAIQDQWSSKATTSSASSTWNMAKWTNCNTAIVSPPNEGLDQEFSWVVNLETGAWSKFTGWRVNAFGVLDGDLFYGDDEGNIFKCDTGGTDSGQGFVAKACLCFDDFGSLGVSKFAQETKGRWKHFFDIAPKHDLAVDYELLFANAPEAALISDGGIGQWDVSAWDTAQWATSENKYRVTANGCAVYQSGEVMAPTIQITSNQNAKLNCEFMGVHVKYFINGAL